MAHSHHLHREHQVSHRRVHHILKDEPAGAEQHNHSHAFSKVTSKTAAESHDHQVRGRKSPKRYAKGGRVKGHKGNQTNIAIVMPHRSAPGQPAPVAGPAGGPPGIPAGGPPGAPPAMPPGMPPGMPMRARGGKVQKHIDGESTEADIKAWGKRASKNSYARGGAAKMTAGAATGVGRLEEAHIVRRRGK